MKPLHLLAALGLLSVFVACRAEEAAQPKEEPTSEPSLEAKVFDLFTEESMDDWEEVDCGGSGPVSWEDGQVMVIEQGEMLSGVIYKKADQLPKTNYELTLDAERRQGVDFFCAVTFPVGSLERCATLVLGGWGGSVTGISSIDRMDAANNATGTFQRYEDDKWYAVRLRVTPENLSAWIDEKQVVDIDIEGREVGIRPGLIEAYLPFSLTTFNTTGAIKNVIVKEIPRVAE